MPTFPINQGFNLGKASFAVGGGPKTKSYKSKETRAADLQNFLKRSDKLVRTQYQSSGKDWTKKSPEKFKLQVGKGQGSKRKGKYIDKHGRRDFSEHNIDTRGIWGEGAIEKQASYKPGGYLPPNPIKFKPYTPFKMKAADYGNSPMRKNFGVGDPESPDNPSPYNYGDTSPAKLFGGLFGGGGGGGIFGGGGVGGGLRGILDKFRGKSKRGGAAAAMGGAAGAMNQTGVPPYGDEAHTGGGAIGEAPGAVDAGIENPIVEDPRHPAIIAATARRGMQAAGGGVSAGFNAFSDSRVKENIKRTDTSPSGIPIYEFNYIGDNNRYSGAMAQDLLEINPDAVSIDISGYYKVNYNNIDVDMHLLN